MTERRSTCSWPFVIITSPADEQPITGPRSASHVVRGSVIIRARVWDGSMVEHVVCSVDDSEPKPMARIANASQWTWDSRDASDGRHAILVQALTRDGRRAQDEISVYVSQSSDYAAPLRRPIDREHAIPACRSKGILGTQLGPNKNGTKGPWPSWRNR